MTTAKEYIQSTFETVKLVTATKLNSFKLLKSSSALWNLFSKNILNTSKKTFWLVLQNLNA